jgi:hypothetical protein
MKGSELCIQPASRRDDPANNEETVLDGECDKERHGFYFNFLEGNLMMINIFVASRSILVVSLLFVFFFICLFVLFSIVYYFLYFLFSSMFLV